MVRRWSYLNTKVNSTLDVESKSLEASFENHSFKVFKKTTFFRKYSRGITSFVRRKNILRKRKTNNVVLTFIASSWVSFYLRLRRICRYSQSKYVLRIAKSLSSVDALIQKGKVLGFASGAMATTLPKKMSRMNLTPKDYSSRSAVMYSPYEFDKQDLPLSDLLLNSYLCDTHYFYELKDFDSSSILDSIAISAHGHSLNVTSSIRSIIVLCTLLNISK